MHSLLKLDLITKFPVIIFSIVLESRTQEMREAKLHESMKQRHRCLQVWNICKYGLAIVCGFIAYASLVPAVFWSLLYKIYGLVTEE